MIPSWATDMIDNYRRLANLPDTVTDARIWEAVKDGAYHISSGQSDEENALAAADLREDLGCSRKVFNA
jgi:hypothetical protein